MVLDKRFYVGSWPLFFVEPLTANFIELVRIVNVGIANVTLTRYVRCMSLIEGDEWSGETTTAEGGRQAYFIGRQWEVDDSAVVYTTFVFICCDASAKHTLLRPAANYHTLNDIDRRIEITSFIIHCVDNSPPKACRPTIRHWMKHPLQYAATTNKHSVSHYHNSSRFAICQPHNLLFYFMHMVMRLYHWSYSSQPSNAAMLLWGDGGLCSKSESSGTAMR